MGAFIISGGELNEKEVWRKGDQEVQVTVQRLMDPEEFFTKI
jgi:hypothetical protein